MRILDLFCGAGGAAVGYRRAGFHVYGVDVQERPNYPYTFILADAIDYLRRSEGYIRGARFDAIHASPPCQAGCTLTNGTNAANGWGEDHPQLIPELREALDAIDLPYVIEQPQGHNGLIRTDLRLCMDMFPKDDPPWVQRHRDFEISGFTVPQPDHVKHQGYVRGMRHGVVRDGPYVAAYGSGGGKATVAEMQWAMGIYWTDDRSELTEAIPPAYTEHIGRALLGSC